MTKRQAVVDFALAECKAGITEMPPGSNKVKYNDWYYPDNHIYHKNSKPFAWCGTFCAYVYHFACQNLSWMLPKSIHDAIYYVPLVQNILEQQGRRVEFEKGKPGDTVIFDFQRDKFEDHIGILVKIEGDYAWVAEGNTSDNKRGSQSNGGKCVLKKRHRHSIEGIYNPFDDE